MYISMRLNLSASLPGTPDTNHANTMLTSLITHSTAEADGNVSCAAS